MLSVKGLPSLRWHVETVLTCCRDLAQALAIDGAADKQIAYWRGP